MGESATLAANRQLDTHLLHAYIADLELEIDRLRKHAGFVQQQTRETLKRIHTICVGAGGNENGGEPLLEIVRLVGDLLQTMRDLQEQPGYHPALDQVAPIAIRPLVEQVHRWQQRLENAADVALRLSLDTDHVEWFPGRLRHILDNLVSNALRYRDPHKEESWVQVKLSEQNAGYEFVVADNGVGLSARELSEILSLLYRATPARAAGFGVGLAVVKLVVEQSGGTLTAESEIAVGSNVVVVLPRYEVDDFLT